MRALLFTVILILLLIACGPAPTAIPPGTPSGSGSQSTPPATLPTATPPPMLANSAAAITLTQQQFPELKDIRQTPSGTIGAATNIVVQDRPDGWNLIFWQGSGDCPAGCINNHYWYISVDASGKAGKAGEYIREYDAAANMMKVTGAPLWGVPKQ